MTVLWNDEDTDKLRELVAQGNDDRSIGKALGRSYDGIRRKRRALNLPSGFSVKSDVERRRIHASLSRKVAETPETVIYAPEETDDEPFPDLLNRAISQTDRDVEKAVTRRFCVAELITSRPVAISFVSDQHLTMHGPCDVRRAFTDAGVIQSTPGMFCLLGGDGVDNHIRHAAAMVSKGSRPSDEYRLYDGYLKALGHKVLAMISGNHDDWTRDVSGVDMVGILAARHRIHYAPDVVVLTVKLVGEPGGKGQEYTIKLRHQYRYNSSLNVGHAIKRMYDMDGDQFDVGVLCHNHVAHVESFDRHGETRWAIRPGSYQVESAWSRRIGFGLSYPTCPGVVLWPGERRIDAAHDLKDLVERLDAARRVAA